MNTIKSARTWSSRRFPLSAWLFLLPSLAVYSAFFIYPALDGLWVSLHKWSGFTENMEYIGLGNFIRLASDSTFWDCMMISVVYFVAGGVCIFFFAFLFSWFFDQGIWGKKLYKAIIFLPFVIAPIAHAIYWSLVIYSSRTGMLNQIGKLLHIDALAKFGFLLTSNNVLTSNILWSVTFLVVWVNLGFFMVIIVAAVDRIPPYYKESAKLEGANELQIFFRVTLPLVRDIVSFLIILWQVMVLKMFDLLYGFGGVEAQRPIWNVAVYLYIMGFGRREPIYQLGYASAIAAVTLFLVMLFALLIRRVFRGDVVEY